MNIQSPVIRPLFRFYSAQPPGAEAVSSIREASIGFGRKKDFLANTALLLLFLLVSMQSLVLADSEKSCVIITGLGGIQEYEENFQKWGESVERLCREQMKAQVTVVNGSRQRRDEVLAAFKQVSASSAGDVWFFLIGHANFDSRNYKFNIKGPDLTGDDLKRFFDSLGSRNRYIVLATSTSGVLLPILAGPRRVVLSATRSARERHPPLFMSFFLEGAESAEADRNKDGRVSLEEIFAYAEAGVESWYSEKSRIQTEHPVLQEPDDTVRMARFAYLSTPPERAYRSLEARELAKNRVGLEREIEALKLRKPEMQEADYYGELQRFLVELATLNEKIRELEGTP